MGEGPWVYKPWFNKEMAIQHGMHENCFRITVSTVTHPCGFDTEVELGLWLFVSIDKIASGHCKDEMLDNEAVDAVE